jgi:hypothetical protein
MVKKSPIGIRFEQRERDALDRAANHEERAISDLIRRIVTRWLKDNGWFKDET